MEYRVFKFGKYKGKEIKEIIMTHIGYVMWCLSNIDWFKLTEDEQDLYDAVGIAMVNSEIETTFPLGEMASFIRDKEALKNNETPFRVDFSGRIYSKDDSNPIVKDVLKYRTRKTVSFRNAELLAGLCRQYAYSVDDYYDMTDLSEMFY